MARAAMPSFAPLSAGYRQLRMQKGDSATPVRTFQLREVEDPFSSDEDEEEEGVDSVAPLLKGMSDLDEARAGHREFFSNCQLALCVAAACTVCGIPTYCRYVNAVAFGHKRCGAEDIWRRRVLANGTLSSWEEGMGMDGTLWCGYLPTSYRTIWPNFIQMIVFTAYQNTGTTVKQAWQGIVGTGMAVLNNFVMGIIYPRETSSWVGWLDTLGFIFLVLVCGCEENTKKFAMSWHVFFMMTFLNPNASNPSGAFPTGIPGLCWDQYTVSVLLTAGYGCFIAVLTTLFPNMLLNYREVTEDAESTEQAISKIWGEAIVYFCGRKALAKRFALAEAISGLKATIGRVQRSLEDSWWETFDVCAFGKKRRLYRIFDATLQRTARLMVAVQDSLLTEDFAEGHAAFCDASRRGMMALREAAALLLEKCQAACVDGDIDEEEHEEIQEAVGAVRRCQERLLRDFRRAQGQERLSFSLLGEDQFCFALSAWARKVADCAEGMLAADSDEDGRRRGCAEGLLRAMLAGLARTWRLPGGEKLLWALRNFISIAVAFWVGYALPCFGEDAWKARQAGGSEGCPLKSLAASLFTPFDANMAATLGLLISHYPGAALVNNIQRLLGVVMGKVLPMVIHGAIAVWGLSGMLETCAVGLSLFLFTWGTNYMYYSSRNWSIVGCCMAGFGCALLSRRHLRDAEDFSSNYKELAQVVIAICFQIVVDGLFDWLQAEYPRDSAVKKVAAIGSALRAALAALFEGDLAQLAASQKELEGLVAAAQALAHEVEPGMQLMPGYRADFKVELYRDSLAQLELVAGDLTMLLLASRPWRLDPVPADGNDKAEESEEEEGEAGAFAAADFLNGLEAVQGPLGLRQELLRDVDVVMGSLEALLAHGSKDSHFQEDSRTAELLNLESAGFTRLQELRNEVLASKDLGADNGLADCVCEDPHARLAVALRSLLRAKAHVGEILRLLVPHIHL